MKYLIILLFLFVAADFSVEIDLENPEVGVTYTDAFKVSNLDYVSGVQGVPVTIISEGYNITKTVKKYTKTKTSNLTFVNDNPREVCVEIIAENDSNTKNNFVCKEFFSKKIDEDCGITLFEPRIFEDTAKFSFEVVPEDFELTYWVEDLYGNVVKDKKTTTNKNKKSFTPKTEGTYILKTALDCGSEKQTFFAVKKDFKEELLIENFEESFELTFSVGSKNFVKKGIEVLFDEELILETDLVKGKQIFTLKKDVCGEHDIQISAGEYYKSIRFSGEECEEITIPSEINAFVTKSSVIASLNLPKNSKYEVYLRKKGQKVSNTFSGKNSGLLIFELIPEDKGAIEVYAIVEDKVLIKKIDYELVETTVESAVSTPKKPLITASAVSEEKSSINLWPIIIIAGLLYLIADKFLKSKRASKINEKFRN